jgi:hypothetical protein
MFPTYTQDTEGELFVFHTKERGSKEYSSSVRVNPVRFLLIQLTEGDFYAFNAEKKGRDKNSTRIRVNPVCFLLFTHILRQAPHILYMKGRKGRHILVASQ